MPTDLIWTEKRAEEYLPCGDGTVTLCCPSDGMHVTLPVFLLSNNCRALLGVGAHGTYTLILNCSRSNFVVQWLP